jgi:uncharacterized membrane protein YidH (DUF202 family)
MPFTAAHPAAVLPLRRRLIFSALVIGAMAPDFHYFITLGPGGITSHSLAGAFYLDLPLAMIALCLFHWVLKLPLISLFPGWHQQRLMRFAMPFRLGPPKRFLLITISLLAGIFSHLIWDSFTHGRGWMVHRVAFLTSMPLQQVGIYRPVYNWLQHASTIIGLTVLTISYSRWSQTVSPVPVAEKFKLGKRVKLAVILVIGSLAAIAGGIYGFKRSHHAIHFSSFAAYSTISFVTFAVAGLVFFSIFWHRSARQASAAT